MNRKISGIVAVLIIVTAFLLTGSCQKKAGDVAVGPTNNYENKSFLVDYVNPLIGTSGHHRTCYGGMIPGVTAPLESLVIYA